MEFTDQLSVIQEMRRLQHPVEHRSRYQALVTILPAPRFATESRRSMPGEPSLP